VRDDMPTLAEMGSDGVALDPETICPADGPMGFTLADFTGGIEAPTRAPDITLSADALFQINSAELSAEARSELSDLAEQIRGRTDLARVFIAGHADTTGNDAINDPLSQRRADSVASYLASQGVDRDLLQTRGYGSREPVATNATVEGRRQNRRVEVTLERVGENIDMTDFRPAAIDAVASRSAVSAPPGRGGTDGGRLRPRGRRPLCRDRCAGSGGAGELRSTGPGGRFPRLSALRPYAGG